MVNSHAFVKVTARNEELLNSREFYLAGDVSATNIMIGIYAPGPIGSREVYKALYNGQVIPEDGFNEMVLEHAIMDSGVNPEKIIRKVLAPAGPRVGNKVKMTRAPFYVDDSCGVLINDFVAKAYAISGFNQGKILLNTFAISRIAGLESEVVQGEPIDIRGVGTGFGRARLYYENGIYIPKPAEGGHEFLAIGSMDDREVRLHKFLIQKWDGNLPHWEAVCSGQGLCNVYEFFLELEGKKVSEEYLGADSKQRFIAERAKLDSDSIEADALYLMYEYFGRACRSSSVSEIARGGCYASGGMIKRDIKMPNDLWNMKLVSSFMKGFLSGPTHKVWADKIDVTVLLDPEDGLKGALHVAQTSEFYDKEKRRAVA